MLFIMQYWYLWVIGLILLPMVAVLPQIKNIHQVLDQKEINPREIAKLFLNPGTLAISIMGAAGTFVCFVFFLLSVLSAIISYIKS
jgi:vacuolar-type H+-ATPase subunit I/STV1